MFGVAVFQYYQGNIGVLAINDPGCAADGDCKIIYSNCGCEAVVALDSRESLVSHNVCVWNDCYGKNVFAVCANRTCLRSDADKE